ncbi:glycosyltransferase family 4 protein [Natrialbaceae archaeon A-CW2]|uniref:glycosyltransferase family 4 protein n=1 Tax=Natronosalvus amylolyticus TaxID=2961994 RepID=UPI0020CA23E0|nr:glycosyltransferase family 4 protein [Natronosalvus amylolyticus]
MRLAFVSYETVFHRDNETNRRLQTVLELLHERGHEVHVCCVAFWDSNLDTFEKDGIVYHGVADSLESGRTFMLRLPFTLWSIGPDIVHTASEPPGQVHAASWGASLARAPLLTEWYGEIDPPDEPTTVGIPTGRWYDGAITKPDRVIAPSRMVGTWVRERGATNGQVAILPNPIDLERISDTPPGANVDVVYARRLDEGANLESLLLGLAELRDRNWNASILGDGPHRENYESLTRDLRIDDRVTFVGDITLEERIAAYRSAHVFVQTATECVYPTELAWALGAGCIGIVEYHTDSAAHELVEGRERGFRTTSEQELADAILEAGGLDHLTIDDSYAHLGRSKVIDRYLELYEELQESNGLL